MCRVGPHSCTSSIIRRSLGAASWNTYTCRVRASKTFGNVWLSAVTAIRVCETQEFLTARRPKSAEWSNKYICRAQHTAQKK